MELEWRNMRRCRGWQRHSYGTHACRRLDKTLFHSSPLLIFLVSPLPNPQRTVQHRAGVRTDTLLLQAGSGIHAALVQAIARFNSIHSIPGDTHELHGWPAIRVPIVASTDNDDDGQHERWLAAHGQRGTRRRPGGVTEIGRAHV